MSIHIFKPLLIICSRNCQIYCQNCLIYFLLVGSVHALCEKAGVQSFSVKKGHPQYVFENFTEKHLYQSLFFYKAPGSWPVTIVKWDPLLSSFESCEIFENVYFEEHLRTVPSVYAFLCYCMHDVNSVTLSEGTNQNSRLWPCDMLLFWIALSQFIFSDSKR